MGRGQSTNAWSTAMEMKRTTRTPGPQEDSDPERASSFQRQLAALDESSLEASRRLFAENQRVLRGGRRIVAFSTLFGAAGVLGWVAVAGLEPALAVLLAVALSVCLAAALSYQGYRRQRFLAHLERAVTPKLKPGSSEEDELVSFVRATADTRFQILSARSADEVVQACVAWGLEARVLSDLAQQRLSEAGVRLGTLGSLLAATPRGKDDRARQVVEVDAFLSRLTGTMLEMLAQIGSRAT